MHVLFFVVMSEYYTSQSGRAYDLADGGSSVEVTVRTVFPETWIWQLAAVGLVTILLSVNII